MGGGVGSGGRGTGSGGQGGCERRSEVFVNIQKKIFFEGGGSGGGGVGEGGSKVWGRWVMLGMGDVNHE